MVGAEVEVVSNESPNWNSLAAYVHQEIGYAIEPHKYYLLDNHIKPLMKRGSFPNVESLVLRCRTDTQLRQEVINAVTINETYFFRDEYLWKDLNTRVIPELVQEVKFSNTLRILICACSKGQEIYTLAMVLDQMRDQLGSVRADILATDIDTSVIEYAQAGIYSEFELSRGLDPRLREKYFKQVASNRFQIDDSLKQNITFQQWNLAEALPVSHRFDLIFCRNVMIYFDVELKKKVFGGLAHVLNNYGYLAIGGSESALNVTDILTPRRIGGTTFLQKVY